MKRLYATSLLGVFWFIVQPVSAAEGNNDEGHRLDDFFEASFQATVSHHPILQTRLGMKKDYDKLEDLSDAADARELAAVSADLAKLKTDFNYEDLPPDSKVSYRVFEYAANRAIDNYKWRFHDYPINQMFGYQSIFPAFMINQHLITDRKDAESYVARLKALPKAMEQLAAGLKVRAAMGIIPPRFVFPLVLNDCRGVLTGEPFDQSGKESALLMDFKRKVNALPAEISKGALITEANDALVGSVKPAYEKLIAVLTDMERSATEDAGAWKFPDGAAFYDHALQTITTTNLTAEQIHETGLQEMARIHEEMKKIMKAVNFKNDDLHDFFQYLHTDPKFYFQDTAEGRAAYLKKATDIIATMKGHLDELFLTKPKADIVVKPVEPFREKSAGAAFYEQPAPDGSRPGTYYVNLSNMKSADNYSMEATAYHEGIPGHHMQISIAQEAKGIPKFRRFLSRYTAYVEGWGLYSELTPKEIGFYKDPYSDFGRLSMESMRAARLVIDTGLHRKKWTREEAIKYFTDNTPLTEDAARKEVERYCVLPGQATAYKIGMLKLLALRATARKELGPQFDLRQFHDVILTNGELPLDLLGQLVNDWIAARKAAH